MCLNKLYLRNPKLDPNSQDKPQFSVNCCKCPECIKEKSNDWFVRSYFEIFHADSPKVCFLVTLDFDDNHLPLYKEGVGFLDYDSAERHSLDFSNLPDDIIPCFDNKEIKRFLDRLRYYVPPFRYLCVAEYGGFLKRPHHHILFIFNQADIFSVTAPSLLRAITKCWRNGSHTKVNFPSEDVFSMIKYIVPYVTKDFSFDIGKSSSKLPYRFRPRILPSLNYGSSAIKKGLITPEFIKNVGFVLIDKIKYKIPRYYEQKFTNDYYWDSDEKKAYRPINDFGRELAAFRHNRRYVYYIKEFFASRHSALHVDSKLMDIFYRAFPDSPYNHMHWRDIVYDVMSERELFEYYCKIKDFVYTYRVDSYSKYYKDTYLRHLPISDDEGCYSFRSNDKTVLDDCLLSNDFDLCIQACFLFDTAKRLLSERQLFVKNYEFIENQKKRAWNKLRTDPHLVRYLNFKHFDFRVLNYVSFSDYYELSTLNRFNNV